MSPNSEIQLAAAEGIIPVQLMQQQQRIRHPEDDWTGLSNRRERKRRQNRMNQRLRRQRLAQYDPYGMAATSHSSSGSIDTHHVVTGEEFASSTDLSAFPHSSKLSDEGGRGRQVLSWLYPSHQPQSDNINFDFIDARFTEIFISTANVPPISQTTEFLQHPRLPADALLTLTQHNVYRALLYNVFSLGLDPEAMKQEIPSPFTILGPYPGHDFQIAPSLQPTSWQRTVLHHPYIDIFPVSSVRDALICAGNSFDDIELCRDIFGIGTLSAGGQTGLIVWGEPWDPFGWEVTETFAMKWPWLVAGSEEISHSTNYWRAKRGEQPLTLTFNRSGDLSDAPHN